MKFFKNMLPIIFVALSFQQSFAMQRRFTPRAHLPVAGSATVHSSWFHGRPSSTGSGKYQLPPSNNFLTLPVSVSAINPIFRDDSEFPPCYKMHAKSEYDDSALHAFAEWYSEYLKKFPLESVDNDSENPFERVTNIFLIGEQTFANLRLPVGIDRESYYKIMLHKQENTLKAEILRQYNISPSLFLKSAKNACSRLNQQEQDSIKSSDSVENISQDLLLLLTGVYGSAIVNKLNETKIVREQITEKAEGPIEAFHNIIRISEGWLSFTLLNPGFSFARNFLLLCEIDHVVHDDKLYVTLFDLLQEVSSSDPDLSKKRKTIAKHLLIYLKTFIKRRADFGGMLTRARQPEWQAFSATLISCKNTYAAQAPVHYLKDFFNGLTIDAQAPKDQGS